VVLRDAITEILRLLILHFPPTKIIGIIFIPFNLLILLFLLSLGFVYCTLCTFDVWVGEKPNSNFGWPQSVLSTIVAIDLTQVHGIAFCFAHNTITMGPRIFLGLI